MLSKQHGATIQTEVKMPGEQTGRKASSLATFSPIDSTHTHTYIRSEPTAEEKRFPFLQPQKHF